MTSSRYLLVLGIVVLLIGILVPSPNIEGHDTGWWKHFGGGAFCGFLWLFLYRSSGVKLPIILEAITIYALVSMLGIAVELVELGGTRIDVLHGSTDDTSWDLLANTLGAFSVFFAYRAVLGFRRRQR